MKTQSRGSWIVSRSGLFFALCCAPSHAADLPAHLKRFVSVKGYVVDYPDTWHVMLKSVPTLYIANFLPSMRVRAVVLPEGGASNRPNPHRRRVCLMLNNGRLETSSR
jgi:hypothetical protein